MTSDDQRLAILDSTVEQIGKTGTGMSVRDFNGHHCHAPCPYRNTVLKISPGVNNVKCAEFALTVFPLPAVGVGLVVGGSAGRFEWSYAVGDLLALGAAAAWVWYSLAISPVVGSLGTRQATAGALGIAALLLSPLALFEAAHHVWWRGVSWEAWGGLIYSAAVGHVVAMSLWGRSMYRLGTRQTMPYTYLEPVSAVVIAAIILGESLSAIQAAGALLTLLGVWLASDSETVSK